MTRVATQRIGTLVCGLASAAAPTAHAADYPTRPIRVLVGFAAGGAIDAMARPIAQKLSAIFGHQVILDNRPGAGGMIAADIAAKAQPDGHTLLFVVPAFAINATLQSRLPFDPVRGFTGVTQIADASNVLSVPALLAANSVKELVALAKTKPLAYGSTGVGSIGHLAGELFNDMAGMRLTHVPYKGGGPAMVDLIAGQIQLIFASPGTVIPQIKAGRIRALAVATLTRSAALPDTPTVAESGVPGYEAKNWYGLLAPARTPNMAVQRLNTDIHGVLAMADVRNILLAQGIDLSPSSPEQFTTFVHAEIVKWSKVVRVAGIKAE